MLYEYNIPDGIQRLSPQISFLITSILSDNEARIPSVWAKKVYLRLERTAAAKTGTTDNSKDNWTFGYTPNLVTGVWVGNSDGRPMKETTGLSGAAPIWNAFMKEALKSLPEEEFERPPGLVQVEVCRATGMVATPYCDETRGSGSARRPSAPWYPATRATPILWRHVLGVLHLRHRTDRRRYILRAEVDS